MSFHRNHGFNFTQIGNDQIELIQIMDLNLQLDGRNQRFPVDHRINRVHGRLAGRYSRDNICQKEGAVLGLNEQI